MDTFKDNVLKFTGIDLSDHQLEQFNILARELLETNKTTNLTAIRNEEDVYIKHFLDSLTLIKALPPHTKTLADIGSGAGFPGLPIAIALPNIEVVMIESIGKKVSFIEKMIQILKLKNSRVIQARAEVLAHEDEYKEKFDVVTARAVAFLPTLIKFCLPLTQPHGVFVAMKNENKDELKETEDTLHHMNASVEKIIPVQIQGLTPRELIVIRKN